MNQNNRKYIYCARRDDQHPHCERISAASAIAAMSTGWKPTAYDMVGNPVSWLCPCHTRAIMFGSLVDYTDSDVIELTEEDFKVVA